MARFYGADVLRLPAGVKLRLLAQVDGLLAEELLRAGVGPALPAAAYRAIALLATGSEREADRLTTERMAAQMDAGHRPA